MNEREKKEVMEGVVYLTGRLQTADVKNGNGRKYPEKVLKREMIKDFLDNTAAKDYARKNLNTTTSRLSTL